MTEEKKKGKLQFGSTATTIGLIVIIIIAINVIAAGIYFRWDITEENLYTLSDGTVEIVEGIKTPITIKYYFTKNLQGLPITHKTYGKKIDELLLEFKNLNSDMIDYEVFDPKPDSDEEEWAKKYGLSGIDIGTGETVFMGVVVIQEDNEISLPFMDPRREQFLEYDIVQLLLQANLDDKKTIGVMSSLPIMGFQPNQMQMMQGQRPQDKWVILSELEKTYNLQEIKTDVKDIADGIDILFLIHPKGLSELTQYAIDQFVLRGGELVVLVDANSRIDQAAMAASGMRGMGETSSDLDKLFAHWGVDYESTKILGDIDRATPLNFGGAIGVLSYALWHSLNSESFNQDVIATKELENMMMVEPGAFLLKEDSPLKVEPLISSTTNSSLIEGMMTRYSRPPDINAKVVSGGKQYYLAGVLSGDLTSAFAKRPESPKPKEGEQKPEEETSQSTPKPHVAKSKEMARVLLITDVDFISDNFSVEKFNLLGQTLVQPKNDNLNFMINLIEFLSGDKALMKIRSRGRFTRPFTRFEELQKKAQTRYQKEEEKLDAKLKEVQARLNELNVEKGTNKIVLTKEQIDRIKSFREEEKKTKSELRKIRKLLRQDIEAEKTVLTLFNLLVIPVILIVIGLVLYYRRMKSRA